MLSFPQSRPPQHLLFVGKPEIMLALSYLRFITRYLEDWQAVLRFSYQLPYLDTSPSPTNQSLKSTPDTHSFRSIGKALFTP